MIPFNVIDDKTNNMRKLYLGNTNIDSCILNELERIIRLSKDKQISFFEAIMGEDEEESSDLVSVDELIYVYSNLISFDSGYFRVEHDVEHANGNIHPTDHIDVFYSQKSKMKFGFEKKVTSTYVKEMLDLEKDRKFLSK